MRLALGIVVALLLVAATLPFKANALIDRSSWPAEDEFVLLPPTRLAPVMAMGERELWADITWIRAISYYTATRHGESDLRYLNRFIDNIIALDPKFRRVYEWAAYAVTFKKARATQEEFRTSVAYLEKGIEAFPDDWQLLWTLGQRYWLDLDGTPEQRRAYLERASDLVERAMRAPNSAQMLPLYAASLRSKLGQRSRAVANLRELILTTDNEGARRKMLERYGAMTEQNGLADELERARKQFHEQWQAALPYAPAGMYIIMGDAPSPVFEFDDLATERDLFGTEEFVEEFGGVFADLGAPATASAAADSSDGDGNDSSGSDASDASTGDDGAPDARPAPQAP